MTTKTIPQVITVDKTIYIASDGKEFDTYLACDCYEQEIERKQRMLKIKGVESKEDMKDVTPLDGEEYLTEHDYRWHRPKSIEEVELLNEFYKPDRLLTEKDIGEWVCFESYDIDSGSEPSYVRSLKDSIKHIEKFLDAFGYYVTITER